MTLKSEGRTYAGLENCAPNVDRASSHIWPQKVNLQVFSQIGKTMKKLYLQYTPANLQYFDVCIYAGVKTALSTHGLGNI